MSRGRSALTRIEGPAQRSRLGHCLRGRLLVGFAHKGSPLRYRGCVVWGRSKLLSVSLVVALGLIALDPLPGAPHAAARGARLAQDPAVGRLEEDLDEILGDRRLAGAEMGVVVRAASTGELLYSRDGDVRLLPASNEKLLTSFAALEILGPSYRFKTSALADGAQRGEVLEGSLYLKGTGDPTMLAADYRELAARVAASGIRSVEGGLVADDTWFDDVRLGPDWTWDDEPYAYAAQVSALTVSADEDFDAGSVIVDVAPDEAPGKPARVTLTPATDYLTVVNRAVTTDAGASPSVAVDRSHGTNTLVVTGAVPLGAAPARHPRSVWDPTGYAAVIFRHALLEHGVRVSGATSSGPAPAASRELAQRESIPLSQLLVPFLKLSNNGHAEILVKAMGRQVHGAGTWDAGLRAVSERLAAEAGLAGRTLRARDGSGLSRANLIPPEQLSALLMAAQDEEWFSLWYEALPIAGEADRLSGGTLRSRMKDTAAAGNVHAKTGTLTSVTALSGYVTSADGERMIFSVMLNNYLTPAPKDIEDAIAVTLAEFTRAATPAARARPQRSMRRDPVTSLDAPAVECSWIKAC